MTPKRSTVKSAIKKVDGSSVREQQDVLAIEEPLEIRLTYDEGGRRTSRSISVTMRTPGADYELAAGFLFSEGIVKGAGDIHEISYCVGSEKDKQQYNVVSVSLRPGVTFDAERLARHFYTSSSCGVCGKASLEAVKAMVPEKPHPRPLPVSRGGEKGHCEFTVEAAVICALPEKLMGEQTVFAKTGGLHAAGLFDGDGKLLSLREDVGRHNALDKVVGERLLAGKLPLSSHVLMVSGRASFEIMQKALLAGIPVVAAVGAPSSLAVSLAQEFDMTLLGFVRGERFNIYSGAERIRV